MKALVLVAAPAGHVYGLLLEGALIGLSLLIWAVVGYSFHGVHIIKSLKKARALDARYIAALDKLIETQQEALRQMDAVIMAHVPGAVSLFPRKPDGKELN